MPHQDPIEERYRATASAVGSVVFWRPRRSPGAQLRALARAADELDLGEVDSYGFGGAVEQLEAEVAGLLGKPAAALFPSGVMAQQSILRVWCDRAGSARVALPDLSHLLTHEADGPRRLHGFEFDHLTVGRQLPTAQLWAERLERPAAVLIELPLRDAGCILPSWEELTAFAEAVRGDSVAIHLDGARLWECQPHFARPLAEIAGLFDSVYVSLYKVLGAPAGAVLAGPEPAIAEARLWRKRMGGTLYSLYPLAVAGLVGLRDELPKIADLVCWSQQLSNELRQRGIRVTSDATNTLEVFADGDALRVNSDLIALCEREGVMISPLWRPSGVPGVLTNELACQSEALNYQPRQVADWMAQSLGVPTRP